MAEPFLAMIIPVSGGAPTHPIAPGGSPGVPTHPIYYPPGIWAPTFPTNPIAPGGQPPGIWGGGGVGNYPDAGLPPGQPAWGHRPTHPIYYPPVAGQGPGFPTNPIAPGGQPPYPSQGPGFPTNPIAPGGTPPGIWGGPPNYIDIGGPGNQPGIWNPAFPTNPIVIPPEGWPEKPPGEGEIVIVVFIPGIGYKAIVVPAARPDQGLPPTEAQPKPEA